MFLVTLTPLKNGEPPADDDQELPAIQLHSHPLSLQASSLNVPTNEVRLGRNGLTKLVDAGLPRRLASVRVTEGGEITLTLSKRPEEHIVHLNGERITSHSAPLQSGSVLALLDGNKCQYRVSILEDTTAQPASLMGSSLSASSSSSTSALSTAPTLPAVATDANKDTDDIRHRRIHQVCEELLCPVCMDILVQTVALNPCGHLFCLSCRHGPVSLCPTCRTPAFGAMPLKSIDGVILHMVKGGFFPTDDAKYYLTRTGHQVTEAEKACINSVGVRINFPPNTAAATVGMVPTDESSSISSPQLNNRRRKRQKQINLCYAPFRPITNTASNDVIDLTS